MRSIVDTAVRAASVLLVLIAVAGAQPDPLETIAPGLTASGLCPLVNSNPQAVIDAIAAGASQAYDQGTRDQYAAALGSAVVAANDNGCINQVFEAVNQAIIKGGYKVEAVVGKALALGVASGTAGAGDVLAKATAVVICKGGESASACARAWAQAIQIDPTNGCAVLKTAYVYAKAFCSEGTAKTQVQSTFFVQPLGQCGQSDFTTGGSSGSSNNAGTGGSVNQGSGGQTVDVSYPGGSVQQGSAGQTVTYPGGSVVQSSGGQTVTFPFGSVTMGSDGISWGGRKMLAVQNDANAAATNTGVMNGGQMTANAAANFQGSGSGDVSNIANAAVTNTGIMNGGQMTANAAANFQGSSSGGVSNVANAAATNTGVMNGGSITSNAAANVLPGMPSWMTGGRKLLKRLLAVVSVANASAVNTGVVNNGQVTANAVSNAQGFGSEDVSSQANAAATNAGVLNGGSITSNAVSNVVGGMPSWMTSGRKA